MMTPRDALLHARWSEDNAFERAAKMCEAVAADAVMSKFARTSDCATYREAALACAAAIRLLKAEPDAALHEQPQQEKP